MVSQSFHEAYKWICDVMSSCYMLFLAPKGLPQQIGRPQDTLLLRLPLIYILTRYQVLLRLLLIGLHSRLNCSIQRRPSRSLLRETFLFLSGHLFFDLTTRFGYCKHWRSGGRRWSSRGRRSTVFSTFGPPSGLLRLWN